MAVSSFIWFCDYLSSRINLANKTNLQSLNIIYLKNNLNTNEWHHIVGAYDGASVKLFRNGALVQEQSSIGEIVYDE